VLRVWGFEIHGEANFVSGQDSAILSYLGRTTWSSALCGESQFPAGNLAVAKFTFLAPEECRAGNDTF
jgi:hypothetical protein